MAWEAHKWNEVMNIWLANRSVALALASEIYSKQCNDTLLMRYCLVFLKVCVLSSVLTVILIEGRASCAKVTSRSRASHRGRVMRKVVCDSFFFFFKLLIF